jgi:hypothetical protein
LQFLVSLGRLRNFMTLINSFITHHYTLQLYFCSMKFRLLFSVSWFLVSTSVFSQYKWKLSKDKDGIKVYTADVPNSSFKAIQVDCSMPGTYAKLVSVLTNVPSFSDWVYNTKMSKLLKKNTTYDFLYYTETHLPWPLSNRDAIIHFHIQTDSLPRFLYITGTGESGIVPDFYSKVRVKHYQASWKVTMPDANTLHINYIMELDPGGSIPAWLSNMFVDKGPYGTFSNLAKLLHP